jgi:hypothetical protein
MSVVHCRWWAAARQKRREARGATGLGVRFSHSSLTHQTHKPNHTPKSQTNKQNSVGAGLFFATFNIPYALMGLAMGPLSRMCASKVRTDM